MTTLTIDIADNKATDLSKYAKRIGGHVVDEKKDQEESGEEEVTHGKFFGENIARVINTLRGR